MTRSNADWTQLIAELRKIVDNPQETAARKEKAQKILDGIFITPTTTTTARSKGSSRDTRRQADATQAEWNGRYL